MKDVDLIGEIRAFRDEFARSYDYDLAAIAAAIREADNMVRDRLVQGEPRRPAAPLTPNKALQRTRPAKTVSGA